jgi:uncharacterized glyoxalase superfamily protein PhnB
MRDQQAQSQHVQRPKVVGAIPWLACADLSEAMLFFESKLGFAKAFAWSEPSTDAGVERDGVMLYLTHNPKLAACVSDSEITITVEHIDELYAEHVSRGAPIEMAIRDEPWGAREYRVRAPSGYVLRFSGEPTN